MLLSVPTRIKSTTNAIRKLTVATFCCHDVTDGNSSNAMAANNQTRPLPLCSNNIKYFLGTVRPMPWKSLVDSLRSKADQEFGGTGGMGLGSSVMTTSTRTDPLRKLAKL